jgi:hypothetical protein
MDSSKFQIVEDMTEVRSVFKEIFEGKTIGTDDVKMGTFLGSVCAAKLEGNQITFALPFNAPIVLLVEILKKHKYNKSNTIFCECEVNDDNTIVTATYFTKEFKMFEEF